MSSSFVGWIIRFFEKIYDLGPQKPPLSSYPPSWKDAILGKLVDRSRVEF